MPTAFITGASQGIGAAIARHFSRQPDAKIALVSRTKEKLVAVSEECVAAGAEALVLPCDVTDPAAVADISDRVLDEWGAPDLLVNNAGQFVPGSISETSAEDFRYQIDVNLN
ncbi:MAG: SDR family oxidoreductase, partial [Rhodothermia bacterium]|nr:SDR family oxidoreductase [Rhodothermia bacterium]